MVSDLNFTIGLTESKYKRSYDVAKAAVQQDEDKVLEIIEKTLLTSFKMGDIMNTNSVKFFDEYKRLDRLLCQIVA